MAYRTAKGTLEAPFTKDEIDALLAWQASSHVHPLTHFCNTRNETVLLKPTRDGFVCEHCPYGQIWCFDFMIRYDPLGRARPSLMVRPEWHRRGVSDGR